MGPSETGALELGLPLMVPAFATFGMACLRLCKQEGRAALDLDDYAHELLFRMAGDDVLVCSTMRGLTVKVNYNSLFTAWLTFAREVIRVVNARHPDRAAYGWWSLIDDYPEIGLAEELTRPSWFEERKGCFE
jgi:hypothetical protein